METSKVKRILAHYNISIERLVSKDEEVQQKEAEKFVNYLRDVQHMTPDEVENFFTNLKIEFLNLLDEEMNDFL